MKYSALSIVLLAISLSLTAQIDIDQKVDSLLNLMTLDEKIGQMAQAERGALETINDISYYGLGSLLSGGGSSPANNTPQGWANMYDNYQDVALQSRLGIPLIYGIDAVHGHNNVIGAVIFPHNIGLGCTWNTDLVKEVNKITALEVAGTGIDWTFSPCIAVPRNERWGRTYEGFGETAEIQKLMSYASVIGLQGDSLNDGETILACAKHFVGDGGTTDGIDQGNTQISEELLRSIHMAGYIDAIDAGVGSVMASYNSWNGQKLHGHDYLLNDVLKEELGFEGFVVSDWKGVDQINEDYRIAVKRAINAGIDMVMVPDRYIYFISVLKSLVQDNEVSMDRIDDAVRRILKQKFLLNLFEEPKTDLSLTPYVGSMEHRQVARQAVRESLVLLDSKNDILPLDKNNSRYLIAGNLANDLGALCGGWSISWQGSNGNITEGTNILEAIVELNETSEILYSPSGSFTGEVDAAVVVIGENPYAEGAGDKSDLRIEDNQVELIKSIKEKGVPVICIIVSGRPMIIGEILPYTDAVIAAWLPGTEATGIADILFGDYLPKGKLSYTWPRNMRQLPINFGDDDYNPLYEYKHGLQDFPKEVTSQDLLVYSASTNTDGREIQLILRDTITSIESTIDDFAIKVNGSIVDNALLSLSVNPNDETILILELDNVIKKSDTDISVSYNGNDIWSGDLVLELLEDYIVYNAVSSYGGVADIPGIIQAENYNDMHGIQTEPCTDVGGGTNVAYIEPGDWMKYSVEVLESGTYEFNARISGYVPGALRVTFNNSQVEYINYTSTNGWQSWRTFNTEVYLEKGSYTMKAIAQTDGFNINYFEFNAIDAVIDEPSDIGEIEIFPNPAVSNATVQFNKKSNGEVKIKLYTSGGKLIKEIFSGKSQVGMNEYSFHLNTDLQSGMYFIEIKNGFHRYFKKLIIN